MKQPGAIALVPFPYTSLSDSKMRPVLVLRRASQRFDDWLVCMVSSQLHQAEPPLDEVLGTGDSDFRATGLKVPSVIRLARLAVVSDGLIAGTIGQIDDARLTLLRLRLAEWIAEP